MLGGIPVTLNRPLTMETAAALIQRQADNYFSFKKPQDSLERKRQRRTPSGARLQLRAHHVCPVMPEHRGQLSTSLTHLPAPYLLVLEALLKGFRWAKVGLIPPGQTGWLTGCGKSWASKGLGIAFTILTTGRRFPGFRETCRTTLQSHQKEAGV